MPSQRVGAGEADTPLSADYKAGSATRERAWTNIFTQRRPRFFSLVNPDIFPIEEYSLPQFEC